LQKDLEAMAFPPGNFCTDLRASHARSEKFFNTSGPIKPEHHYNIEPLHRMEWEETLHLIRSERSFVLHAPRQTGKTSTLLAIMA